MPDPLLMGKAFGLAAALAFLVVVLAGRTSATGVLQVASAAAVVLAAFAGLWLLDLLPHMPPRDAFDRLLVIVVPAAAAAEFVAAGSVRAGWVARGVVATATTPVLLHGSTYVSDLSGPGSRAWPTSQMLLVFAGSAVVLTAAWAALHRFAARTGGRTTLLTLAGSALAGAVVVMMSGYASGGQFGVPLGAGLCGVAAGSLLIRNRTTGTAAAAGVGVVALFGLLVIALLFADLTTLNAALLFAAPLLGWLPELTPLRPHVRSVVRLGLAAAPVVVAVLLAHQKFEANSARPTPGSGGSIEDYMNFGK
jgi:hypothetical protein